MYYKRMRLYTQIYGIPMAMLLLLLYVKFLCHSPWFYAKNEYLGRNALADRQLL